MDELNITKVRELVAAVSVAGRILARLVEEGFSSAMKGVIRAVNDCIGFIDHHDEYNAARGDVDFPPLPPIWIVGEEGVGKRTLSWRLRDECAHRERFVDVDCRKANTEGLTQLLFGDDFSDLQGGISECQGLFWDAEGGILVIREPSILPAEVWERLAEWQRTGRMRRKWPHGEVVDADVVIVFITSDAETLRYTSSSVVGGLRTGALRFIHMPPLRNRPEDIILYLEYYLRATGDRYRGTEFTLTDNVEDEALLTLVNHSWPENLLGLRRAVEFMVVTDILRKPGDRVNGDQARIAAQAAFGQPEEAAIDGVEALFWPQGRARKRSRYPGKEAMENFERHIIEQGSTQVEAARALGVADSTLSRYRKKAGLPPLPLGRPPKNRFLIP